MKTEYAEKGGCLQRDGVEDKEYAEKDDYHTNLDF